MSLWQDLCQGGGQSALFFACMHRDSTHLSFSGISSGMHPSKLPTANGAAISTGMRGKSDRGYVIGAARLGYARSRTHAPLGVEHIPDPDVAPFLAEAFLMAAAGRSVRQVAAWLAGQGVEGNRGGPVSPATVQRMLNDPFYAGFIRDQAGRLTLGTHMPLTDRHTFALVQRRLIGKRCRPDRAMLIRD